MASWSRRWRRAVRWLDRIVGRPRAIPESLWQQTLQRIKPLQQLPADQQTRLRELTRDFLADKEFFGAHGLRIRDDMALAIAAQACWPLLHWGDRALERYGDFVGIVVHRDDVLAPRENQDPAGVVHRYHEPLSGEAMHGGPVMLVWSHVLPSEDDLHHGRNLVVHEFAHKIDMRGKSRHEAADGCPLLWAGFMGAPSAAAAQQRWRHILVPHYHRFRQQVEMAERFGAQAPWLDAYGAHSPAEFFAVLSEAYFTHPQRLAQEFPELAALLEAFYRPTPLICAPAP